MTIEARMAALADTAQFRALVRQATEQGEVELTEEATMLLAGVLCVDCRVRLKVVASCEYPGLVSVELMHDGACPTWRAMARAARASEN